MADTTPCDTTRHEPITVRVRYYAMIRKAAGVNEETVTISIERAQAPTFAELLKQLCERHEGAFRKMILDTNNDPSHFLVMYFNGEPIWGERQREHIPRSGDLALYSPVGGG